MAKSHEQIRRKRAAEAARRVEYFVLNPSAATDREYEEYLLGEQYNEDLRRIIAAARLEMQRESVQERRGPVARLKSPKGDEVDAE